MGERRMAAPEPVPCTHTCSAVLILSGFMFQGRDDEDISRFRHFWHWTLAGVDRDGPPRPPRENMTDEDCKDFGDPLQMPWWSVCEKTKCARGM